MPQENNFLTGRIFPFFISLSFFVVICLVGCYCWRIDIEISKIYGVFVVIYFPFLPIFLVIFLKYPERAYGGLGGFVPIFLLLASTDCRPAIYEGGASMIQIPIMFVGFAASIIGIILFEIGRVIYNKIKSPQDKI